VDNYLAWFRFMDEREEFQDVAWVRGRFPVWNSLPTGKHNSAI